MSRAPNSNLKDIRQRARASRSMTGPREQERAARRLSFSLRDLLWLVLLLTGLVLAVGLRMGMHWVATRPMFEIHQVRIVGDLDQVDRDLVRKRALGLHSSFFNLDLNAANTELRTVPWVRAVAVRRVWPDTLEISVDEHRPLARWGESELLNTHGERFVAEYSGVLPYLQGPNGSEAQMFEAFQAFRSQLASVPLAVTDLELSDRGAWRLTADNGLEIALGRDDVHARLARFITIYPQLLRVASPAGAVADLRYSHGFALRAAGSTKDPSS